MGLLLRFSRLALSLTLCTWLCACTHDWDRKADDDGGENDGALPGDDASPPAEDGSVLAPRDGGTDGNISPRTDGGPNSDGGTLGQPEASPGLDGASEAAAPDAQSGGSPDATADTSVPPTCPANHGCPSAFPCVANPGGYTCLGLRADWPVPLRKPGESAAAQQFTVTSATLLDQVTGLMWERVQPAVARTWEQARVYCDALSLDGHDDFRMPSHIEMATWLATDVVPKLDGALLGTYQDGRHWTVTPDRKDASLRWVVLLANGVMWSQPITADEEHVVRCVRTHQQKYSGTNGNRTSVNAAGVVLDRATGLSWEQSVQGAHSNLLFTAANAHCEGLTFDGKSDWRLPTSVELLTTMDPSLSGASALVAPFLGPIGDLDCYWSSSLFSGTNNKGEERFIVSPGGDHYSYPIADMADAGLDPTCAARCVRK